MVLSEGIVVMETNCESTSEEVFLGMIKKILADIMTYGLGIIGAGLFYFGIFYLLRESKDGYPGFSNLVFYSIGLYLAVRIIYSYFIEDRIKKCGHGVRGGKTRGKCHQCRAEEEEATLQRLLQTQKEKEQRDLDSRYRESERLTRIQRRKNTARANSWRESERLRLKEYYLRRTKRFDNLNPFEFEKLVGQVYERLGYEVQLTPRTNDQGCDAILRKDGETSLVECKLYSANRSIGRPLIQKFHSAMNHFKATSGFFVTTGFFANTAVRYAEGKSIKLIGPQTLLTLMDDGTQDNTPESISEICRNCGEFVVFSLSPIEDEKTCACGQKVTNTVFNSNTEVRSITGQLHPCCPLCEKNSLMISVRKNGEHFWQCKNHPGFYYVVNEDGMPMLANSESQAH